MKLMSATTIKIATVMPEIAVARMPSWEFALNLNSWPKRKLAKSVSTSPHGSPHCCITRK
jgi:hypothetical protein